MRLGERLLQAAASHGAAEWGATLDVEAGAEDSDSDLDDDPVREPHGARGGEGAADSGGGGSEVGGGWLYTKCRSRHHYDLEV